MYGYIGDKLNIEASSLNKENIVEKLNAKQIKEETIVSLIELLDKCEFERYAPTITSNNLQETYTTTILIITKLEDEII